VRVIPGARAKIGLLTVTLPQQDIDHLLARFEELPGSEIVVDLESQTVSTADGSFTRTFEIDPFVKQSLLEGLDEIGLTLREEEKIAAYERERSDLLPKTPVGAA
jgi:3-isopropylmalate/(R)-2-methylmalate dehydratase small subunit